MDTIYTTMVKEFKYDQKRFLEPLDKMERFTTFLSVIGLGLLGFFMIFKPDFIGIRHLTVVVAMCIFMIFSFELYRYFETRKYETIEIAYKEIQCLKKTITDYGEDPNNPETVETILNFYYDELKEHDRSYNAFSVGAGIISGVLPSILIFVFNKGFEIFDASSMLKYILIIVFLIFIGLILYQAIKNTIINELYNHKTIKRIIVRLKEMRDFKNFDLETYKKAH